MATNKRLPVKWIRDRAKAAYNKDDACFVCGTNEDLELHHLHSISVLLEDWCKTKNIDVSSDEAVLAIRDQFISDHYDQIYNKVYTLCNTHHVLLHKVYGKSPANHTASKQEAWLKIQQDKFLGIHVAAPSPFDRFIKNGNI